MNKGIISRQRVKRGWQLIKNLYHLAVAIIANIRYGFPSRHIKVIGVTGTDGKTTTANLIYHILLSSGKSVSLISTVFATVGGIKYETGLHTTNPDSIQIQRLILNAVSHQDEYIVIETTSHGIDQHRVFGVKYFLSIITNVSHEHLDYHPSYEDYATTKIKLLIKSEHALVNRDDASFTYIKKAFQNTQRHYQTYSLKSNQADYQLDLKQINQNTPRFNQYNYCAAYAACRILGLNDRLIYQAINNFRLPTGRWELVYDKKFKILIDFAHTPNAFGNLLPEARKKLITDGRLIHVFGAAGLRDYTKRYSMGKISAQYSDVIILTEEDYRTEDLYNICEQIGKGIRSVNKNYTIIKNRYDAIANAIKVARTGDIIVLTGKAHEQSLCRNKTEYQWDEKKTVMEILKQHDLL